MNVHREGVALAGRRGQTDDMRTTDLDISGLSLAERIQLAGLGAHAVPEVLGELPLSAAQTAELDRRLAELARDPGAGESWEVVRGRVERRLHKTE